MHKDSEIGFEGYHPSCMWGIFHFLDYHLWHNDKKKLLRGKHGRRKHGRRKPSICFGNPKTVSFHADGVQEYVNAEAVPLLVEEQTKNANPTNRCSGKDRIKALLADEMSKRSRLLQTRSVHCLEPRYDGLDRISTDWTNQIIILHTSADKQNLLSSRHTFSSEKSDKLANTTSKQDLSVDKHLSREFSYPQFKECADVLELFKLNKKLFLEMLQNPDVQSMRDILHTSNDKGRLWRSGSFPAADSSRLRYLKPSSLEHKQKEIWSFRKGQKLPIGVQSSKLISSNSLDDSHEMSVSSTTDSTCLPTETGLPSLASSHSLVKHGWKSSFLTHFRDVKKKLRYALKESKKMSSHALTNERVHKVRRGEFSIDDHKISEELEENKVRQGVVESCQTNNSDTDLGKSQLPSLRRASSVNESIDRYTELLEKNFGREVKWHQRQSRSLKLSSKDRSSSTGNDLKYFRRRLSLPELESLFPMPNEILPDLVNSQITTTTVRDGSKIAENDGHNDLKSETIPLDTKMSEPLDAIEVTELHKNITESVWRGENYEYSGGLMEIIDEVNENEVKSENHFKAHTSQKARTSICDNGENEEPSPVSVPKTHVQDDTSNPIEFPAVEGAELNCWHNHTEKPDCSHRDSLSELGHTIKLKNVENTDKMVDSHLHNFESNIQEEDGDLSYVRDVLETSGFLDKEQVVTWYSVDEPLSPTLFKELESYIHHQHQQETSSEEADHDCDHHHLFDLINEELLNIYGSSLAYFPKHMSRTPPVRTLPKGTRVLEEVWKRIKWYKTSKSLDQSLDDIVDRDFKKGDGWLNLYFDVEDVTLDLEEWILDELLDEVMC